MKKFQKKTFGSKSNDEGLKTSSPMPKVYAERYIEEMEPQDLKEFITYGQISIIYTGKKEKGRTDRWNGWAIVGIKFGEAASRNITTDIRKIIEENKPLKKVKHDENG